MTKSNLCLHNLWSAKTVVCFWGEETDLMRFGGPPDLNFVKKLKSFLLFKEERAPPADAPSLRNGYILVHSGKPCFIAVGFRFIEESRLLHSLDFRVTPCWRLISRAQHSASVEAESRGGKSRETARLCKRHTGTHMRGAVVRTSAFL